MAVNSKVLLPADTKRKPPAAGKGRVKGVPNKTTRVLKEAILLAAERVGRDGKGQRGITGYLEHLAQREPASFASLLGKILPLQLTGSDGRTLAEELAGLRNMPQIHGDSGTA